MADGPTEAEVVRWVEALSNWGRWGPEDERGCLNLIDEQKRLQAASLIADGTVVSCARPISTDITPETRYQVQRFMVDSGEGREPGATDPPDARRGAAEYVGMVFHGASITHLDALAHFSWNGLMYNGRPASLVTSRSGAAVHSVEGAAAGIVSRGVLLDVPLSRGVDWVQPGSPVTAGDLDAAERLAGTTVGRGDIVLIRTANYRRILEQGPTPLTSPLPGLRADCMPWLRERDASLLVSDSTNDARPSPYRSMPSPIHVLALVAMGLWLVDNANLEALARICRQRGRYEFCATVAPLLLRAMTGSPVNPIAVF